MHGYQIIISLRKNFGVYFGPSTIYPLLCLLEERGLITSQWNLENERPRKVYSITPQGSDLLNSAEASLGQIYRKLANGFERTPPNSKGENSMSTLEPRKPLGFTY
jgi:DNA-binding PadR family transcriptional regulator